MERAEREGWCFGAKLVRGAYMFMERDRAKQCGYPSPIHDSIDATHANYNECAPLCTHSTSNETCFKCCKSACRCSLTLSPMMMCSACSGHLFCYSRRLAERLLVFDAKGHQESRLHPCSSALLYYANFSLTRR